MRVVLGAAGLVGLALIFGLIVSAGTVEPFTELSFRNHADLPAFIATTREYPWAAYAGDGEAGMYYTGMIYERPAESTLPLPDYRFDYPSSFAVRLANGTRTYYYLTSDTLPAQRRALYRVRSEPIPIDVVVTNREGRTVSYIVEVVARYNGTENLLAQGPLTLRDGQSQPVRTSVQLTEPFGRAQIVVRLAGRPESIHYWIEERAP